jgi:GT2 family glycosyltransferase
LADWRAVSMSKDEFLMPQFLSIIIVNWKSADYLKKCLNSIWANIKMRYEIIVVDNASFDGSDEVAKACSSKIQFIQLHENVGFAKANNVGYQKSAGDLLLFLNPDTELRGNAVELMAAAHQIHVNAGIVGAILLNTDGTYQHVCVQPFPSILTQILDFDILQKRFFFRLLHSGKEHINVDIVSGACMMIKRSVFSQVGEFSNDYFMYGEDQDLCKKLILASYKNIICRDACIVHHGGKSSGKSSRSFAAVQQKISKKIYFKKFKSKIYSQFYQGSIGCIAIIRLMIIFILYFVKPSLRNSLPKWQSILMWALKRD